MYKYMYSYIIYTYSYIYLPYTLYIILERVKNEGNELKNDNST